MKNHGLLKGHLAALFTILVWSTTYISTKVLLSDFKPVEILFIRIVIGLVTLYLVYPHRLKFTGFKKELTMAGAGLCGITLYFLLENTALTYTLVCNVGIIISVAPFLTALVTHLFVKGEDRLHLNFFIGFLAAMVGICLISFSGSSKLQLNPLGDILAFLAALVWAFYSVLFRKVTAFGYHTILTTRRVFLYGIILMLPAIPFLDFSPNLTLLWKPVNLFNFLFLGLGASAICFVTWNLAVKILGAVKTSVYIYIGPAITILTSVLVLHEQLTLLAAIGSLLTFAGLLISEMKFNRKPIAQDSIQQN